MRFMERVGRTEVKQGEAAIFWLGQAGFLIKTAKGRQIAIDPYFSDCVQRLIPEKGLGFKRLMPPVCEAGEFDLDVLIISHEHNDHFDVDAVRDLVKGKTAVYTNCLVAEEMERMGFDKAQLHVMKKGQWEELEEFRMLPVDCDHGELAPEALGFVLDFGFSRLYYAGDTALTVDRLKVPVEMKPEVAILPINGAFGNLDGAEAAKYAGMLGCRVCIPCHFWTFPLHHGDPQQIIDCIGKEAPECELVLLCQGEAYRMGAFS
ncbi:MBL fold metallo-hydrolase [bacterium 1XD21-13]|nr:MBL fold metallo-hydrolase [bacterium 1XD21-13]